MQPSVTPEQRLERVEKLRTEPYSGDLVDLIPYSPEYAQATIDLRNTDRAKFFLTQHDDLTLEDQQRWYETVYLLRNNDIQWLVADKKGEIVGTNALYDIDIEGGDSGEKGRQVIREEVAMLGPYALEADYIACRLAFDELGLRRVIACFREDNVKVASMNKRMGFEYFETRELRGQPLLYHHCTREQFQDAFLKGIIDHWKSRQLREREREAGA